jgi:hypothetical protein
MAMSTRPEFGKMPAWRPRPPQNRPIGDKTGRFRVIELTVYFDYISDEAAQERHFEMTLRIPMTKANTRIWRKDFWEFIAAAKMEELTIHVQGRKWDEGVVGYRDVGMTNAYLPRYVVINKQTKWVHPASGSWGILRW